MEIFNALTELPEIKEAISRVKSKECPMALGGLSSVHKAHIIATVKRETGLNVLVIAPDELEASRLGADIAFFTGEKTITFKSRDFTLRPVETVSREWEHDRLYALLNMDKASVICATPDALMQRTIPLEILKSQSKVLYPGMDFSPEALTALLLQGGYKSCDQTEGVGQFSRRGGIIDFYPPGAEFPVRLEYFGNEIDTVFSIDPQTQRRRESLESITLLPCAEVLASASPGGLEGLVKELESLKKYEDAERLRERGFLPDLDRFIALCYPEMTTGFDYISPKTIVFVCEQGRIGERIKNTLWQRSQDIETLLEQRLIPPELCVFGSDGLWENIPASNVVFLDSFIPENYPLRVRYIGNIRCKQLPSFGASLDTAAGDIAHYKGLGFKLKVLAGSERRAEALDELLRTRDITGVAISSGSLSAGMEYPDLGIAVLTEGTVPPARKTRKRHGVKDSSRKKLLSYTDLSPGDLVVHEHHGIGRFLGIVEMPIDGTKKDYIKLAYAGSDCLYVPVTQLNLVSKYIGQHDGEGKAAKLHKLGGDMWNKTRSNAKASAKALAKGLIELYAARKRIEGFSFPPDSDWQQSFEESFEYEETEDQLRCALEIKKDMEASFPMDRLLCGDVGFGKTEVALRGVMKCVLGGKQAAILAPTTVLAQQHFQTASRRFAGYPLRIEVLSRFRTPAQVKEAQKRIRSGGVDLIIGTHKLLQKDVKFKNLGLLIIDEEQRFGVSHKEKLKELTKSVDVLTMTATPIPRTLNMALSGIRDMSTLEEAPRDRYPVQTFVLEHNYAVIADAIKRELGRGGQVYYLHNRVETIDGAVSRLMDFVPEATIAFAHGQMKEDELAEMMNRVSEGEIQVLVCTTIIESGIDIPNVNTLIIEDADKLGLAQLHQIRGRVGRSNRHAFAYLTYKRGKILSETASKRLMAIREFAEFGSGFKISMRDLEIRGAGNVLGAEQSGHLLNVGYDMYLKLLEEAVIEESGTEKKLSVECAADLNIDASIPKDYISHPGIRIDIYRRIAAVDSEEEAEDIIDELVDRFGDVPKSVHTLVKIALLRSKAGQKGITEITQRAERLIIKLHQPDFAKISGICSKPEYKGKILFSAGAPSAKIITNKPGQVPSQTEGKKDAPYLTLKISADVLKAAEDFVEAF